MLILAVSDKMLFVTSGSYPITMTNWSRENPEHARGKISTNDTVDG